ncbi:hypothetical protein, partial [Salmonella enterica subsp. enterica serovar Bredeney]
WLTATRLIYLRIWTKSRLTKNTVTPVTQRRLLWQETYFCCGKCS